MLYIANTTKQNLRHFYRVFEHAQSRFVDIPSGTQVPLGANWTKEQTDAVIQNLERYGARRASEAGRKMEKFHGILYSVDKPVNESQIILGHENVVEMQKRRSADEAIKGAKAMDIAARPRGNRKERLAKVTGVEVVQDLPRNQKPTGDEVKFSLEVTPDGQPDVKI